MYVWYQNKEEEGTVLVQKRKPDKVYVRIIYLQYGV